MRLPPPPFWRTCYYDEEVSNRPDRQDIAADEILAAIAAPARRVIQPNGRIRHWRRVAAIGRWLRVVTEADGETVHNAFWDRRFRG